MLYPDTRLDDATPIKEAGIGTVLSSDDVFLLGVLMSLVSVQVSSYHFNCLNQVSVQGSLIISFHNPFKPFNRVKGDHNRNGR